jgi:hypothetical protein
MQNPRTAATVRVDTSRPHGVPLSKERIAIYNSGLVPIERYRRDRAYFRRAGAESLRIDLGWGAEWMPRKTEVVQRDADGRYSYHFEETDEVARLLTETGTRPYWSYCYVPAAARVHGQSWMAMAPDDTVWVDTVREYVRTLADRHVSIGYHEVYNEPDLRDERTAAPHFYEGNLDDYLDLYRATARAIREADPAARVGGPALAVTSRNRHWLEAFLAMVVEEDLPLDFLSIHHYGHFSTDNTLDIVDEILERFDLPFLEVHLNEYNSFTIDYPRGGLQDTHFLASTFAADIPRLLNRRTLTRTHWAQFQDSGHDNFSGMIDIDGNPKPIWQVYEFYQSMPNRQILVDIDGPEGLGAIAGGNDERLGILIWNRSSTDLTTTVILDRPLEDPTATILDSTGTRTLHGSDATHLALERGAVAMLSSRPHTHPEPARRAWRATCARPARRDDSWIDIDERTGVIDVYTGSRRYSTTAILETEFASTTPLRWTFVDHRAPHPLDTGTVAVSTQTAQSHTTQTLRGPDVDLVTTSGQLHRAQPEGTVRYTFEMQGLPPQTRLTIRPE